MAAQRQRQINLLPQEEFEASTFGRILKWLLSTFRILVIATEMIVMIAFLSRFWLDSRRSDLDDDIKTKQAVLAATSDFEKQFRLIQKQLKIFSSLSSKPAATDILNTITQYQPSSVILTAVTLSNDTIQIKGVAPTEVEVGQFITNLSSEKSFKSVTLTQAETQSESSLIEFNLKIILGPKGVQL